MSERLSDAELDYLEQVARYNSIADGRLIRTSVLEIRELRATVQRMRKAFAIVAETNRNFPGSIALQRCIEEVDEQGFKVSQ